MSYSCYQQRQKERTQLKLEEMEYLSHLMIKMPKTEAVMIAKMIVQRINELLEDR